MLNTRSYKTLERLEDKLEAARKAAYKFTMGAAPDVREDAAQDAQLAVLEYHRKGAVGNFSYYYGVAWHRLRDIKRGETRRVTRERNYAERQYGYDAVNTTQEL